MASKLEIKDTKQEEPVKEEKEEEIEPIKGGYLKYAAAGVLTAGLATGAFLLAAKNKK